MGHTINRQEILCSFIMLLLIAIGAHAASKLKLATQNLHVVTGRAQ